MATTTDEETPQKPAQQEGADPYAASPTGYTGFQTYANNNAGASQAQAQRLTKGVEDAGNAANAALQGEYQTFQGNAMDAQQQRAEGRNNAQAADSGYTGPGGFDPSAALTQQYGAAIEQRNALGSVGGVQAASGPRTSRFGADLTYDAGRKDFDATRGKYAGLEGAIGGRQAAGASLVGNLRNPLSYEGALELQRSGQSRAAQARQAENERIRQMQQPGATPYTPPPEPSNGYRGFDLFGGNDDDN